jgi:hypothetical protein
VSAKRAFRRFPHGPRSLLDVWKASLSSGNGNLLAVRGDSAAHSFFLKGRDSGCVLLHRAGKRHSGDPHALHEEPVHHTRQRRGNALGPNCLWILCDLRCSGDCAVRACLPLPLTSDRRRPTAFSSTFRTSASLRCGAATVRGGAHTSHFRRRHADADTGKLTLGRSEPLENVMNGSVRGSRVRSAAHSVDWSAGDAAVRQQERHH